MMPFSDEEIYQAVEYYNAPFVKTTFSKQIFQKPYAALSERDI